jgi:hypothetical protein
MPSFSDFRTRQETVMSGLVGTKTFNRQKGYWKLQLQGLFPSTEGKGLVQTRRELSDQIRELAERVAPTTVEAFDRYLLPVAEHAFDEWPVRSGLSKSLFELNWTQEEGGMGFGGSITDAAPYAWFITEPSKTAKTGRASVVRDLVFTPGERAAEQIAQAIGDSLR